MVVTAAETSLVRVPSHRPSSSHQCGLPNDCTVAVRVRLLFADMGHCGKGSLVGCGGSSGPATRSHRMTAHRGGSRPRTGEATMTKKERKNKKRDLGFLHLLKDYFTFLNFNRCLPSHF